jgi:hypothetical protein
MWSAGNLSGLLASTGGEHVGVAISVAPPSDKET